VTNLDPAVMSGSKVIGAYHDLWQVEKSFRMAKSDLRARPIFHHQKDSIEAHLTIVFAALAISRHLQEATGLSIKKLVSTLRPIRSATIALSGQTLTLEPEIPPEVRDLLATIAETGD
jgi:transposase